MAIQPTRIAAPDFASGVNNLLEQFRASERDRQRNEEIERLAQQREATTAALPGALSGDLVSRNSLAKADPGAALRVENLLLSREKLNQAQTPKPTALMQNFEAARKGGFKGSIMDYQTALKRAGATNVSNVTNVASAKGETTFQKTLGKKSAEMFIELAEDGLTAQNELVSINQLPELLQKTGGGIGAALKGAAANFGLDVGEGTSELQIATQIIDKLTPSQRVPGSGATSDFEAKLFKSALPSLWRSPEANQVIIRTMQALANARVARGRVGEAVATGGMKRSQAIAELRKIPDPWTEFRAWRKAKGINKRSDIKANSAPSATTRIKVDFDGNEIQ